MRRAQAVCRVGAAALALMGAWPASAGDKRAYSFINPTPAGHLRDMATDRPDKTESAYTVDAGRFQVETDLVSITRDRAAGTTTSGLDILPFNLKAGLTHDTDLQLVYGAFNAMRTSGGGGHIHEHGFGDLTVRIKHNLWGNDSGASALAIMPFIKLPTNTLTDLNDDIEGGLIVPVAIDRGSGFGVGLMTEIDILKSEAGGYAPSFVNTATVSFEITDRMGLYVEAFIERGTARDSETVVTIDGGVTFAVTEDIQLDAGANVGVTDAADDLNIFVGLSQRY